MTPPHSDHRGDPVSDNHVRLRGRLSAHADTVTLPSGDVIVAFRLIVQRSPAARRRHRQTVDTIDCVIWSTRLQRRVATWQAGAVAEIEGELRRRFARRGGRVESRYSVDVLTARKVRSVRSVP